VWDASSRGTRRIAPPMVRPLRWPPRHETMGGGSSCPSQLCLAFFNNGRKGLHERSPCIQVPGYEPDTAVTHKSEITRGHLKRTLVLCDFSAGAMRGAKWLVRHKMATPAWDVLKNDERAIVVATMLEAGWPFLSGEFQGAEMPTTSRRYFVAGRGGAYRFRSAGASLSWRCATFSNVVVTRICASPTRSRWTSCRLWRPASISW
jgi:hypothetical protein